MAEMIQLTMERGEWELLASLLEMAGDQFSNHGCNDLPNEVVALLPEERWLEISRFITGEPDAESGAAKSDDGMMRYFENRINDLLL